jgi:stage V sporulation protein G
LVEVTAFSGKKMNSACDLESLCKGGKCIMEITDVKIRKILSDGRLRAVVSVTIDDMFAVHDIKVVQGDERLFVAMPSRKDENGVFRDIVHPISPSARKLFEETILEAYGDQLAVIEAEETADTAFASDVE